MLVTVCNFYLSELGGLHREFFPLLLLSLREAASGLAERLPSPAERSLGRYVEGLMVSEERQPLSLLLTDPCSKGYRVQTYLIIMVLSVIVVLVSVSF